MASHSQPLASAERELELADPARPVDEKRVGLLRLERAAQRRRQPRQAVLVAGAASIRRVGAGARSSQACLERRERRLDLRCTSPLSRALSMRTIRPGASRIRAR